MLVSRLRSVFARGILLACAALLFVSCSTLDVAKVKKTEHAAVPIITVDEYIDLSEVGGAATLAQRLAEDEEFDLSPMVDKLQQRVYNGYAGQLPVTVMSEESVIDADQYQKFSLLDNRAYDDRYENLSALLVPDGYKKYRLGKGALIGSRQKKMFGAVPDRADALMFASASYALIEDNPFWYFFVPFGADRGYVEATVRLEMIDRSGDTILRISESRTSDRYVNVVKGFTANAEKIQPMCVNATEKAFAAVDQFIQEELSGS